jgi:hypothetical protein
MGRLIPAGTGLPKYGEMELWVEGYTEEQIAAAEAATAIPAESAA